MFVLGMWFRTFGVPQGSILGPLTVYINDLLTVPKLCQTACYVDDSKLYLKFKTNELRNAVSAVNSDRNEICRWCCDNSLLMNADNTKLLVIGVSQLLRQFPDFTITLCGKPISSTPVAKDLGVFLDQCLSYDEHIRKTVASFINKLIQINRIRGAVRRLPFPRFSPTSIFSLFPPLWSQVPGYVVPSLPSFFGDTFLPTVASSKRMC